MSKAPALGLLLIAALVPGDAISAERPRGTLVRSGQHAESPLPFRAVGIYWRAAPDASPRVRASIDDRSWTSWIESRSERVDGDRMGSGLIYFDALYRYLQIEGVPDPEILFIDPGNVVSTPVPKKRLGAAPSIVAREQWGCTPQTCPAQDPPLYTTVTHLVVHHTAGANAATDWPAVLRSIWVLHVMGNGWNDIGYNYLIDPNGVLYEGRAGGDGVLGAHFSGVNSGTMGVALLGTYIDVPPTSKMLDTLSTMLAWQADKWRLDPSGESLHAASGLVLNVISGHRDAGISPKATSTTECPGNSAYSRLPQIRREVSALLSRDCPVEVGERNRCIGAGGGTLTVPVQTPSGCAWSSTLGPLWISEFTSADALRVDVAPNPAARRSAELNIGGHLLTLTQAGKGEPDLPCVAMRGVVNSANGDERPVVPGSQISIFGEHLSGADPSPTTVSVNGKLVPVEFTSPGQINFLLPSSTPTGTAHLRVTVSGIQGPETNFWVTEAVPAIFTLDGTRALAANDDGALNGPDYPVKAGHSLT
ncbi:MAG: N-acetylmuramoyl-L-alanine amidase, partial [Acidobacteriota bacterium]|nr:N-acetylmuramoyl-L-alanine amidase [Acidobacteriota bacterium]